MVIITAADERFNKDIHLWIEKVSKHYPYKVYDLGGLGVGTKVDRDNIEVDFSFKPFVILDALKDNDFVVWLDCDAHLQDNIDEVKGDYDLGLTKRKKKSKSQYEGLINAGTIFAYKSAVPFIEKWYDRCKNGESRMREQEVLNKMVGGEVEDEYLEREIRIKLFPVDIYNRTFYKGKDHSDGKIIHYKGSKGRIWKRY
jgi:hypothetical protein